MIIQRMAVINCNETTLFWRFSYLQNPYACRHDRCAALSLIITMQLAATNKSTSKQGGDVCRHARCMHMVWQTTLPSKHLLTSLRSSEQGGDVCRHARCGAADQEAGEAKMQLVRPMPAVQGQQQAAPHPKRPAGSSWGPCKPPAN